MHSTTYHVRNAYLFFSGFEAWYNSGGGGGGAQQYQCHMPDSQIWSTAATFPKELSEHRRIASGTFGNRRKIENPDNTTTATQFVSRKLGRYKTGFTVTHKLMQKC